MTNLQFEQYKLKKSRWCAWDSNPGRQYGRHRRIHWAMAAPPPPMLCLSMLLIPVLYASLLLSSWCLFMSYAFECCRQGDQIWRNSTTLANNNKKLAIYLRYIWFLAKFSAYFGTICIILGAFSLLKIAKYWNHNLVIWSHWLWTKKVNLSFARSMFKSMRSWFEIWSPKGQHWRKIKLHFVHKSKKNCV